MKRLLALTTAATAVAAISMVCAPPAEAAGCYYRLYQDGVGGIEGKLAIQGYASGFTREGACDRARRECNRRFERAAKRGNLPRHEPRSLRCVRMGG